MDVHLTTDAILLSGLSFFSAAVAVTDLSSAETTVVVETIAAGLSSFCYFAVTVVADAEAFANRDIWKNKHKKGSYIGLPFSL